MKPWMIVGLLALSVSAAHAQDEDDEAAGDAPPAKLKEAKTADKVDARDALPATVTITFGTNGPSSRVIWGRKTLCTTPCSITRKRDSGPMDVVFRAGGFLPLHTRAFTFKDDKVVARMVAYGSESKLLGYKEPIVEGADTDGADSDPAPGTPTPLVPAPTAPTPVVPVPVAPAPVAPVPAAPSE